MESCGLRLLRGPRNAFDYVLKITSDGKQFVNLACHRCVLIAHSAKFAELITSENYWDMEINVKPGYVSAVVELIQFMYLKDPRLLTQTQKVLELCGLFDMSSEHFAIRTNAATGPEDWIRLVISADDSECITSADFLKIISVVKGRLPCPSFDTTKQTIPMMKRSKSTIVKRRKYNLRRRNVVK